MDWDKRYKEGDKPWDKGFATPVLKELLEIAPQYFKPKQKTLVPGCGLGHDVALLRENGLDAYGLDISKTALDAARQSYPNIGEAWLQSDIFRIGEEKTKYDLVWEHTCYCAILPNQRAEYIKSMWYSLKPGAYFAGVFFINTGQAPDVGPPFSTTRADIILNFSPHFELVWETHPNQSYPGRENCELVIIWRKTMNS